VQLKSSAFEGGADIPRQFTCDGADISPALHWSAPPKDTQTFALIMDDPDAPGRTWVHWLIYDLPPGSRELPEAVPPDARLASGAHQGRNDFRRPGYGGPCPPSGPAHRYFFKLYALDTKLDLGDGAKRAQVERAMRGHILAEAELMGRYRRNSER
jgi:Raf kinase inhibitor-like YbhB/YbcL family protein